MCASIIDSSAASDRSLVAVLQSILDQAVADGEECGCQLTVFRHGRLLAQLCAGYTDAIRTKLVTPETLFPIFSTGKGIMTTAFHRLVEQGLINYDTRVADVWPDFAGQGRGEIRVWHILSHRAGMHQTPATRDLSELADWPEICRRLTTMSPTDTPGGKCHYHGLSYAWLLGEAAARVAGKPFAQVIQEQVIQPLGLQQEMFFGLPVASDSRAAVLDCTAFIAPSDCAHDHVGSSTDSAPVGSSTGGAHAHAGSSSFVTQADSSAGGAHVDSSVGSAPAASIPWAQDFISREVIRRGFIPSANGFATATAIARHYAALLGHVGGVRLLHPDTLSRVTKLCRHPFDPLPPGGTWAKFGLGYVLAGPDHDLGQIFGQGGAAGAEGLADQKTGLALGFTKNRLLPDHPNHLVRDRVSEALHLPIRHW